MSIKIIDKTLSSLANLTKDAFSSLASALEEQKQAEKDSKALLATALDRYVPASTWTGKFLNQGAKLVGAGLISQLYHPSPQQPAAKKDNSVYSDLLFLSAVPILALAACGNQGGPPPMVVDSEGSEDSTVDGSEDGVDETGEAPSGPEMEEEPLGMVDYLGSHLPREDRCAKLINLGGDSRLRITASDANIEMSLPVSLAGLEVLSYNQVQLAPASSLGAAEVGDFALVSFTLANGSTGLISINTSSEEIVDTLLVDEESTEEGVLDQGIVDFSFSRLLNPLSLETENILIVAVQNLDNPDSKNPSMGFYQVDAAGLLIPTTNYKSSGAAIRPEYPEHFSRLNTMDRVSSIETRGIGEIVVAGRHEDIANAPYAFTASYSSDESGYIEGSFELLFGIEGDRFVDSAQLSAQTFFLPGASSAIVYPVWNAPGAGGISQLLLYVWRTSSANPIRVNTGFSGDPEDAFAQVSIGNFFEGNPFHRGMVTFQAGASESGPVSVRAFFTDVLEGKTVEWAEPFELLDGEPLSIKDNGVIGTSQARSLVETEGNLSIVNYEINPDSWMMLSLMLVLRGAESGNESAKQQLAKWNAASGKNFEERFASHLSAQAAMPSVFSSPPLD